MRTLIAAFSLSLASAQLPSAGGDIPAQPENFRKEAAELLTDMERARLEYIKTMRAAQTYPSEIKPGEGYTDKLNDEELKKIAINAFSTEKEGYLATRKFLDQLAERKWSSSDHEIFTKIYVLHMDQAVSRLESFQKTANPSEQDSELAKIAILFFKANKLLRETGTIAPGLATSEPDSTPMQELRKDWEAFKKRLVQIKGFEN